MSNENDGRTEGALSEPLSYRVPDPVGKRFGRRLRQLRTERGMTQLNVAMDAGLDRSFVSDIERGVKEPTISTLSLLASVFQMSLKQMFEDV